MFERKLVVKGKKGLFCSFSVVSVITIRLCAVPLYPLPSQCLRSLHAMYSACYSVACISVYLLPLGIKRFYDLAVKRDCPHVIAATRASLRFLHFFLTSLPSLFCFPRQLNLHISPDRVALCCCFFLLISLLSDNVL